MHSILARSLALLSVSTYFSTVSILPQTSPDLQNALGYNIAEATFSPSTVIDSKTSLATSVSTIPSDKSSSTIPLNQRRNTDTEHKKKLPPRNLGPFGQEGFNLATYLDTDLSNTVVAVTSQILAPVPSITSDPS
ncbi:uncharacterized protein EAF01_004205 [Botrytis porri]|uniref:uncharacterized protein n=1 Tax=Botrytis porri TaxID=87229 RepID=UPI0019018F7F|nr:uncharacterized protein EAF01_004205 [Botrytis porri]KAF7908450.1 hypothetical protein EAF01_004205 [Botrytis porri]